VALTINDPVLQKVQGYRCRNAQADNSCAIYETRPQTCRNFHCGWRRLKWVRETLRPDISGVLVRMQYEAPDANGARALGVIFTLLNANSWKVEGLAETVAAAVAAGVPAYVHVPGPPGYTSSQARINDALHGAVLTRNKPAILEVLRRARSMAKQGDHEPIVLGPPEVNG